MTSMKCDFWNVGQGLFSSGKIISGSNEFVWVYDCGSMNDKSILNNAIDSMKQKYPNEIIDILAISHFDKDHISGLNELLEDRKVDTLILPYYPLYQRLLVAQSLGIYQDNDIIECYISPVIFFSKKYNIKKILLVADNAHNKDKLDLSEQELEFLRERNVSVSFFNIDKNPIHYFGIEFIPYNVPFEFIKRNLKNIQLSQSHINALWQDKKQPINQKILNIKEYYYQTLTIQGKNQGEYRNILSLYLYIGILKAKENGIIDIYRNNKPYFYIYENKHFWEINHLQQIKNSILYCGDGSLKTRKQLEHIKNYLTPERINRIACLQIPHHGSTHNWQVNLSREYIHPILSVFCADPYQKYKHPHPDVIFDLIESNPILVDTNNSLELSFYKEWPDTLLGNYLHIRAGIKIQDEE